MRAYTTREIDELRTLCENKYLYGAFRPNFSGHGQIFSRSYKEADKVTAVEEMVRTYIAAGLTAKDIGSDVDEWATVFRTT